MESAGAPDLLRQITRQVIEAFFMYPHVVAAVLSIGLAGLVVMFFWTARGASRGVISARLALKAQALRGAKDHRALVLLGGFDGGGGGRLRDMVRDALEDHFGDFAFQAPVQIENFPVGLEVTPEKAHPERRRRTAVEAGDALERTYGDVIIWGRRNGWTGRVDLRLVTPPSPSQSPELHCISFKWRPGEEAHGLAAALAYVVARRTRPVLNKPQDYKPEKLQPIVEALDAIVSEGESSLSTATQLEILGDFASGALSLGERGGEAGWLIKALDARRKYLAGVDRTSDPGAWGRAQQEVGRALAALGEREADRAKLEEAVGILKTALEALRATESLQSAEVAMRALSRAEQTLAARRRIGLRWPV